MADEKRDVAKKANAAKPNIFKRIANWFVQLFKRFIKSFKDMWTELKRVTWPTKRKLILYSTLVLVFMLCMAIIIGLFDMGASALVRSIGGII